MGHWDFHFQNLTFNPGLLSATVSGNVIVNTVAGVPAATFQPINKRLASPVIPGTLTVSRSVTVCVPGHTGLHVLSA